MRDLSKLNNPVQIGTRAAENRDHNESAEGKKIIEPKLEMSDVILMKGSSMSSFDVMLNVELVVHLCIWRPRQRCGTRGKARNQ